MGSSVADSEQQILSSTPQGGSRSGSTPPPQTATPPPSLNSSFNVGSASGGNNRNLLGLTPSDEVVFDINSSGGLLAKLQIRNIANKAVIFKIKTTSPEKYRVRPSTSHVKLGGVCDVEIHVHQSQLNEETSTGDSVSPSSSSNIISPEVSSSLMKDKFLVTAITLEDDSDENLSQSKLTELLKNNRPESQYRLRCSLSGNQLKLATSGRLQGGTKEISPTSSTLASANKQLENLSKKVNELKQTVSESAESIASLRKTTLIMLGIIMFLQLVLAYQVMYFNPGSHIQMDSPITNNGQVPVQDDDNVVVPKGKPEL